MMRVIAGKARRLKLNTVEGRDTRPTTDRIKETLFNMIQYDLDEALFLDLFSGSGGIGIEALSRGAREAYFVEHDRQAAACIRANLEFTKLKEDAVVMECDVLTAIKRLEGKDMVFDFVYMDPPYDRLLEKEVLLALSSSSIIGPSTVIIVEASKETGFDYLEEMGFAMKKLKEYKTNRHVFIEKAEEPEKRERQV